LQRGRRRKTKSLLRSESRLDGNSEDSKLFGEKVHKREKKGEKRIELGN